MKLDVDPPGGWKEDETDEDYVLALYRHMDGWYRIRWTENRHGFSVELIKKPILLDSTPVGTTDEAREAVVEYMEKHP
jgi:hypothetical protein